MSLIVFSLGVDCGWQTGVGQMEIPSGNCQTTSREEERIGPSRQAFEKGPRVGRGKGSCKGKWYQQAEETTILAS